MIDLSKAVKKTDEEYFPLIDIQSFEYNPSRNEISYKDAMNESMAKLGDEGCIFIGYNTFYGNCMGTTKTVSDDQKLETPVAENLMAGLAIGMSFEGFKPVLYFERHDFMLVAADAIGNHIDKIERISHGEYKVPVIIRAVTADAGPFYSGPTHSQDFTKVFQELVGFPVIDPQTGDEVLQAYEFAKNNTGPTMIIDRKSKY
jgi:pyruvate/2-oxoglutarate/acetoin dehydrogenase E1 component